MSKSADSKARDRKAALAQALRDNLKRRKAQARAKTETAKEAKQTVLNDQTPPPIKGEQDG